MERIICGTATANVNLENLHNARSRCIEYEGVTMTPPQFEAAAGLGASKKWCLTIRLAESGETLGSVLHCRRTPPTPVRKPTMELCLQAAEKEVNIHVSIGMQCIMFSCAVHSIRLVSHLLQLNIYINISVIYLHIYVYYNNDIYMHVLN